MAQYHPHPHENAKRQQFPQCTAWACECLDQVDSACDETHLQCYLWNGLAGNQLLAEFGEGIGEHQGAVRSDEVNMVMDCLRNAKCFHAIADTGLKDATDLGV